jgi:hypothetical protein
MAVLRESLDAPAVAAACQLGFGKQQSVLHRCDDNCTVCAISGIWTAGTDARLSFLVA